MAIAYEAVDFKSIACAEAKPWLRYCAGRINKDIQINKDIFFCWKKEVKKKLLDVVKQLQQYELNKGYIILVQNGIFFVGTGKDAVLLHDILGLQVICLKENVCKVGIPVKSIEKYINLLVSNDISFVLYKYLNEENDKRLNYETIFRFSGQKIFEVRNNIDNCEKCKRKKENEKEIIERLKENGKSLEQNTNNLCIKC